MNLKLFQKFITSIICTILLTTSVAQLKTFAFLNDIDLLGGNYGNLVEIKNEYLDKNPQDDTEYVCHLLIPERALNKWRKQIFSKGSCNPYNKFILSGRYHGWIPAIVMEKEDHKLMPDCWDLEKTDEQNDEVIQYIETQANRIIYNGDILGVLNDEITFIQNTFGNKYDRAINEVSEYINYLNFRILNGTTLIMNNPYHNGWSFMYYFD